MINARVRTAAVAVVAVAAAAATAPAAAEQFADGEVCAKRSVFLDKLGAAFGEVPVAAGLGTDGNIVEVLRAPDGGWTMLITKPTGVTCVLAAGEAWQSHGRPDSAPGAEKS